MLPKSCNICIRDNGAGPHAMRAPVSRRRSPEMECDVDRREFIENATILAGAAVTGLGVQAAAAQGQTPAASTGPFAIKPLPFDPKSIKGLSERIIVSHHDNNYAGAVRRLNAITAQLAALDFATAPVFQINGLKREELIAMNSMILHELYFDGLGGGGM